MAKNPYANVGRSVAKVGIGRVPKARPPKPKPRPYMRQPRQRQPMPVDRPVTQTPTVTSTGVTTSSGGNMPGAPDPYGGMPAAYRPPAIKNWKKATAAQIAQAQLAPQYAATWQQQHQSQLMAGQQQAAITSYGLDLAKILGAAGPAGVKGTLGGDYAAALSMSALRTFAYNQFLESSKYADEYAKIAAQYPSLVTQQLALQADNKRKDDAFVLQRMVAIQTYGLNVAKTKAYNQATNVRLKQSQQRITLSQKQYNLSFAKAKVSAAQWNAKQAMATNKIDLQASKAAGKWVNSQGQVLTNVPFKNPPPPYYKPSAGGKGGGGPQIDPIRSKDIGHWVYKDSLKPVPLKVTRARGLPDKPNKPTAGPKAPGLRGLTQTQYRNAYGDATAAAIDARDNGGTYQQYVEWAVGNSIPRWVAKKAWDKYHKGK